MKLGVLGATGMLGHHTPWKCDNATLKDRTYQQIIKHFYETEQNNKDRAISIGDWWDNVKKRIATTSKRYAIRRKQKCHAPTDTDCQKTLIVLGQVNAEDDEISDRFFWRKIKRRKAKVSITRIKKDDETTTENPDEIRQETHAFYQKLWGTTTPTNEHIQQELLDLLEESKLEESDPYNSDIHTTEDEDL